MKKKVFGRKFSRARKGRTALLRSLTREFVVRGSITTTEARVKTLKPLIDSLVTTAKKDNLTSKRSLLAFFIYDQLPVQKLESEVKARFSGISSGFSTHRRIGMRNGDNAPLVMLKWSREPEEKKPSADTKENPEPTKSKKKEAK